MKWHYRCPKCNEWRNIDWKDREKEHSCHIHNINYMPPGLSKQQDAYVDTHDWPAEMEEVVVELRGDMCTVPGCTENYETLDHRIPYSKSGKTSVENLWPMCNEHNQSKGDRDYDEWLTEL